VVNTITRTSHYESFYYDRYGFYTYRRRRPGIIVANLTSLIQQANFESTLPKKVLAKASALCRWGNREPEPRERESEPRYR
jgi:hypothetical protein